MVHPTHSRRLLGLLVLLALQGRCVYGQGLTESLLLSLVQEMTAGPYEPPDHGLPLPQYDFVVVGAGTAGCAVAARLSEVPGWSVLLVEAGGREHFAMDIPIVANMLQFSNVNWKYRTQPSKTACLGMSGRRCNYPRGKVMGGSSVLNYMIYNRGHPEDYNNWERMGSEGWGFKDVLPYFKKLENMLDPELRGDRDWHNVGGPVSVTHLPWHTPLGRAFIDAYKETGYPEVDYNGAQQLGVSPLQVTMQNGSRWSSNRAYLSRLRQRRGAGTLHVLKNTMVTKVLTEGGEAQGVELVRAGRRYTVRVRREVVVSAGAINSPHLLMLSGIGPREHLQDVGIPVVADLPVGYNLMDHVSAGAVIFTVNDTVSIRTERVTSSVKDLADYFSHRSGPLSIPGGCEALAFLALDGNKMGWPDLEMLFVSGSITSDVTFQDGFGLDRKLYKQVFGGVEQMDSWMPLPMLMRPKSKGRVMLRDRNPLRKPLIYHNYFDHPEDLDTLVDGVLEAVRLSGTRAFQRYASRLNDEPVPACKQHAFGTRDYWRCHIRHFPFTIYHQSGTCRMGRKGDPLAVLDPRLRVQGVRRLRVVDASVMPMIPAAHTNVPTYMIAEKAADMIKEDNGALPRG
ncbi:Glucose dehydrogenase acceptor-like [Frankliniella occidentalis]|uniref:Glucose dehydrogenase [FAD, quinone]-like n=1 Tax=Frankliniella occidentalis TaxID=133901 RepID=A0A6J1SM68_FRAOC|nr:glucose dehydrogenase [FAD, quinone]-like [Frankliniella occidentalis]KAE8742437.1 Glucose dehydrogenase acceptor-like [Frankliniella occidentalis]